MYSKRIQLLNIAICLVALASVCKSTAHSHSVRRDADLYQSALQQDTTLIKRISVSSDSAQANSNSDFPRISNNGRYVAFRSDATNLVPEDTNNHSDIFLYDLQTDKTILVTSASDGTQANAHTIRSSISGDGRYIAFESEASNLVLGDTNRHADIFVRDTQTNSTVQVSIASDGSQGNYDSSFPSISANGRYISFNSIADNLINDDTNNFADIFVHDLETRETARVALRTSQESSISGDGRYIAFVSPSSELVNDDTNGYEDIFVYDRQTNKTSRISISSDGTQANSYSYSPSISTDGRYIGFYSGADNLVVNDTNAQPDVFVHDQETGETERISIASNGDQANGGSVYPSLSGDGRYVAFMSAASNLSEAPIGVYNHAFVHDRYTGQTELATLRRDGIPAQWGSGGSSSISGDGQILVFDSHSPDIVQNDTNSAWDVFVVDLHRLRNITSISGKVTDNLNHPVAGVKVEANAERSVTTDEGGYYKITGLITGDVYELIASKDNYNYWPSKLRVQVGPDAIDQDFTEWVCAQNVPLYLQGQPSTPNTLANPTWFNKVYGNYPDGDASNTIGRWGCKTSSDAMMISFFGSRYEPPFATDPDSLNTWLRGHRGYNTDNGVILGSVFSYAWENGVNLYLLDSTKGMNNQSLDENLCSGRPSILKVKNSYGDHFVVATGKITEGGQATYTINDPAHGQTTLRQHYNNSYERADYYSLEPTVLDRSMLEATAHSPIHLLIIDPLGRKLGYDPRTETLWDQIPNAGYDMEAIGDSEGNVLPEVKTLFIRQPLLGLYSLQVVGYDTGAYEVRTYETSPTGSISEGSFSGEAQINSVDERIVRIGEVIYLPVVEKQ
jgi:hypothetical protein